MRPASLQTLVLRGQRLRALPPCVGACGALRVLDASENLLSDLEAEHLPISPRISPYLDASENLLSDLEAEDGLVSPN